MEIIGIVLFVLSILLYFLYKGVKSCISVFEGKKFIVSFRYRNCKVFHFDGVKGNYSRDELGNWSPENSFTLAEWSWADRLNKEYFVNKISRVYIKIFSMGFYAVIIFLYWVAIFSLATYNPVILENNLILGLFFWLILLFSIIIKDLFLKIKT